MALYQGRGTRLSPFERAALFALGREFWKRVTPFTIREIGSKGCGVSRVQLPSYPGSLFVTKGSAVEISGFSGFHPMAKSFTACVFVWRTLEFTTRGGGIRRDWGVDFLTPEIQIG